MNHIRWAALCAVTTILCVPSSIRAEPVSLWNLNGSVISLDLDGPSLAFRYERPRKGMRDEGVKTGTLLFSGTKSGTAISGTGYVFSRRCGAIPYPVSGVAVHAGNIRLYGSSPTALDANCRPLKFQHDVNEFSLIKVIAAPQVKVLPAATGDHLAAAEIERLRHERELEEQRLEDLRAFSANREACRSHKVAACDAALRSPHATAEDAAALKTWRDDAIALTSAVQDCQAGSTAACDTALASPALDENQRTRVMAWKQEASPVAKAFAYAEHQYAALKASVATFSVDLYYRPASFDAIATRAAVRMPLLSFLLLSIVLAAVAMHHRHLLAKAAVQAGQQIVATAARAPDWRAAMKRMAGPAQKLWKWFIDPLVAPPPAVADDAPKAAPPSKRAVKHRDTPGALAAMQLANAYIDEVRDQSAPGFDEEHLRKHQLNTLSLAAKQLDRAEALDPDAVLEGEDKDGVPFRTSVNELKAEAMLIEGLTHQIYDTKRAVCALTRAGELNPNSPNAFYALGVVHAANHNKRLAVQALQRAVALDPGNLGYRKELNRIENMTAAEIAAYKATRGAEHVFDAGVGVANAGIRVYNAGVILWNIFAFTYNVLTWPLRLVLRIAG